MLAEIKAKDGCYQVFSEYRPRFVTELKAIVPASERRFDGVTKSWMISASYGARVRDLVEDVYHMRVSLPILSMVSSEKIGLIEVLYIGVCKARADGTRTALGWTGAPTGQMRVDGTFDYLGDWSVVFPEAVLRAWFGEDDAPERPDRRTFYSLLGIQASSGADEIKAAYRRMCKQWHPDICREPDAEEIFKSINRAYGVLSVEKIRARYDAGLKMQSGVRNEEGGVKKDEIEYRAPLRNGLILCSSTEQLGRKVVSRILSWQDIVDASGRTCVTSWVMGNQAPTVVWN